MAVPVIDPESSILAYPQYLPWEHNFSATNAPYAWALDSGSLPTGMSFQKQHDITVTASTDKITLAGHGFTEGMLVGFTALDGSGAGLAPLTRYYVRNPEADEFQVSTTLGGTPQAVTVDYASGKVFRLGFLEGSATVPGISTIRLIATNGDGNSASVLFTIGIEPAAAAIDTNLDFVWELTTNTIVPQFSSVLTITPPAATNPPTPVMSVKEGDDLLIRLRVTKSGIPLDLNVSDFRLGVKELEPEGLVVVSSEFAKLGEGQSAVYLIYAKCDGDALATALSNYEADGGTEFNGLAEFQMTFENIESIGPDDLVRSSNNFTLQVNRDLINN